ncbi:hypothetical protein APS47_00605 [Leptospira kirschneri serovar Mozdok]|nr:hypothetical protein APS47_00605 [Leptospira kirschneri serovar Mozdok]
MYKTAVLRPLSKLKSYFLLGRTRNEPSILQKYRNPQKLHLTRNYWLFFKGGSILTLETNLGSIVRVVNVSSVEKNFSKSMSSYNFRICS